MSAAEQSARRAIRRLGRRARRWYDRRRAPWPVVGECYSSHIGGHSCEQCQPTHKHEWTPWPKAPGWVTGGPGVPVRCRRCGARKCDASYCNRRRHDHTHDEAGRAVS